MVSGISYIIQIFTNEIYIYHFLNHFINQISQHYTAL